MRGLVFMGLMCSYYALREAWIIVIHRREIIHPFPYAPEQGIAYQTFWYMFCGYAGMVIVTLIMWLQARGQKVFWLCVFILQLLEFIEFRLNYNFAWRVIDFGLFKANLDVTNFRYLVLLFAAGYEFITYSRLWKK